MRIAFVTPTLHSLGPIWRRDPQIVKLAAPTLAGFLRAHGYQDMRQYDFEVQLLELEEREPGRLDLKAFFEDEDIEAYLRGENQRLDSQVELILGLLEIEPADLFAFSCASTIGIYADMHAATNINICLAHELKRRFPDCTTIMGGMQISPDDLQTVEYQTALEVCKALDFTAEGPGEHALLRVLKHMEGADPLDPEPQLVVHTGHGIHFGATGGKKLRVPGVIRREEKERLAVIETPDLERPEGDHKRLPLENASIRVTPWFDPKNIELRKISGSDLLERYHLGPEWHERMKPWLDEQIAVLPYIFMEGCNARCAFCAYSMTTMVKQDIGPVIESMRWMSEIYGVRYFHFLNTNINGSMKYAEAFCDALIAADLNVLWSDCANLWALNDRVMDKLAASGCVRLTFGLECPSPRMLEYLHKGIDVEQAHYRLEYLHKVGIWNHLLLITGLPTETPEDTAQFVEFLERSADYVHGYSVSSFYLISKSLMGAFPHRYNIEMLTNESGLLEDSGFNEIGGLQWKEKQQQIIDSTALIQGTIARIKTDPKYSSGSIDLELLFWLYDHLGANAKPDVVRAFESGFIGTPNHMSYFAAPLRALLQESSRVRIAISRAGATVQVDDIRVADDRLVVPMLSGTQRLDMHISLSEGGGSHAGLASGQRLQVHEPQIPFLHEAVADCLAPGSPALRVLAAAGWRLRAPETGWPTTASVTVTNGPVAISLTFLPAMKNGRYFVQRGALAMVYSVRAGDLDIDGGGRSRAFNLLQAFGDRALTLLGAGVTATAPLELSQMDNVARVLVDELEKPHREQWQAEPQFAGFRHGDRFSRVAQA